MSDNEEDKKEKVGPWVLPGTERRGPFVAPKKLTDEEKQKRKLARKAEEEKLYIELDTEIELKQEAALVPKYDKNTKLIAKILSKIDFMIWNRPKMARLYMWRYQLFNALFIWIIGAITWLSVERAFSILMAPAIATFFGAAFGFFVTFFLYSAISMFKKVQKDDAKRDNSKA